MNETMKKALKEELTALKQNADEVDKLKKVKEGIDLTFIEYVSMIDEPIEEVVRLAYNKGFTNGMKYNQERNYENNSCI